MLPSFSQRRRFSDLSEQEVLALAISAEEDDARIYRSYAERLRSAYPASAAVFDGMAAEEDGHRRRLIDLHEARFGKVIPLIRREHVAGFYARKPVWLAKTLSLDQIRAEAHEMERQARDLLRNRSRCHDRQRHPQAAGRSRRGRSRARKDRRSPGEPPPRRRCPRDRG